MSYSEDLIRLVDERIALARRQDHAQGTMVTRDTTGPGATVTFDGSTTPMPVKVAGGVAATDGDRVLLTRHGSDWIVTESFSSSSFGEASRSLDNLSSVTGGLTNSSFVDLSEFGTFQFSKAYDLTFVRLQVQVAAYTTVVPTRGLWALRFTPISGGVGYTPTDISMGGINWNTANAHESFTSPRRVISIPSGTYTVSLRWRRASGTGSIIADTNDSYAVEVDERVRASVPIL